jgi:hypothetical protein
MGQETAKDSPKSSQEELAGLSIRWLCGSAGSFQSSLLTFTLESPNRQAPLCNLPPVATTLRCCGTD